MSIHSGRVSTDPRLYFTVSKRGQTNYIHLSELSTHTHTHTHTFNGPFSGTTRVSRYQKGKTNLVLTNQASYPLKQYPLREV